jgi:hypothetical protein
MIGENIEAKTDGIVVKAKYDKDKTEAVERE